MRPAPRWQFKVEVSVPVRKAKIKQLPYAFAVLVDVYTAGGSVLSWGRKY